MNFVDNLNKCSDFACIFELVKVAVEETIGKRRVGLMLALSDLPNYIGAFHIVGSNFIVMNKKLLKEIVKKGDKKLLNAYVFHILLHEYIHSLGCIDEEKTQILTYAISERVLGPNHPSTLIAKYGISYVFSRLSEFEFHEPEEMTNFEIIDDFERDNLNYFG
jgi:hypothetical protein